MANAAEASASTARPRTKKAAQGETPAARKNGANKTVKGREGESSRLPENEPMTGTLEHRASRSAHRLVLKLPPSPSCNIRLSTSKLSAIPHLSILLPSLPYLAKNVVLLPLRSQNTLESYALPPVPSVHYRQLDAALRAARSFWSEFPPPFSPHWASLLHQYAHASVPFPTCPAPSTKDFFHATITSPDSAPGADGLPYAAWRVCPTTSSICLNQHFQDIIS